MSGDLAGRACLVTGGTTGLGRAIVDGFVAAGAAVVAGSSNPDKVARLADELGPNHIALAVDVVDEASVGAAVRRTVDEHGRIDVLVHAAGTTHRAPTMETSLADFERVVSVNLTGTFLACREAGAAMARQTPRDGGERGAILTVASLQSFLPFADTGPYAASKAAVASLTQSLANDWSALGIRVNALAPGVFPTDLNRALIEGTPRGEEILVRTPMGRFGRAEELVGAALYLCSDAASYTTGVILPVDGGFLARGVGT